MNRRPLTAPKPLGLKDNRPNTTSKVFRQKGEGPKLGKVKSRVRRTSSTSSLLPKPITTPSSLSKTKPSSTTFFPYRVSTKAVPQFRSAILDLEIDLIEKLDEIEKKPSGTIDQDRLRLDCYRTLFDQLIIHDKSCGHLLAKIKQEFEKYLPPKDNERLEIDLDAVNESSELESLRRQNLELKARCEGLRDTTKIKCSNQKVEMKRRPEIDLPPLDFSKLPKYSESSAEEQEEESYFNDE